MQTACILRRRSNRIRVYKDLPRLLIVLAAVFIAMEVLYWYNPYCLLYTSDAADE